MAFDSRLEKTGGYVEIDAPDHPKTPIGISMPSPIPTPRPPAWKPPRFSSDFGSNIDYHTSTVAAVLPPSNNGGGSGEGGYITIITGGKNPNPSLPGSDKPPPAPML